MAKANLKSKEIRQRLKPKGEPYWMEIDAGLHLGYRKNLDGAVWCVRSRANGKYRKRTIGDTDDNRAADGVVVWSQWWEQNKAPRLCRGYLLIGIRGRIHY
jgi:hypothetical protein